MTYAFYNFLWKLIDYFLINYLNLRIKKGKEIEARINERFGKCYIRKEKPVKEFPYQYKTHMYHLHQKYLTEYKTMGDYINLRKGIEYVNELEPARLMHIVNYQTKQQKIENVV